MSKDYEVGFGKPPKKTQFQKGKSGNPKGRPKGSRDLSNFLDEGLAHQVVIAENGVRKKVSRAEAIVRVLLEKALKGDLRAITTIAVMHAKGAQQADARSEKSEQADTEVSDETYERSLARLIMKAKEKPE